jgi:hypothetical protein
MSWLLVRQGTTYVMDGGEQTSNYPTGKTKDGDLVIKTPEGLTIVLNDDAPEPPKKATKPKGVLLKVPYWKQTDNYRDANRTCFSSSMAMIIEYLLPDELPNDDTYVKTVFNIGDTTDASVQVKALGYHNIVGTYRQNMDFDDLDSELAQGYPVGVAILHRGTLASPTGGHWIVCTGRSEDGSRYQFNDPYGSLMDAYQGEVENGKSVWYSRDILRARWTAEGTGTGWGMTCRKK